MDVFEKVKRIHKLGFSNFYMSPLVKVFELLNAYDEVPLPDRQVYRLKKGQLFVKHKEDWIPSDLTVSELAQ